MFKEIRNPDLYHKPIIRKNFFEGWYFKIVSPDCKNAFSFIPGIFNNKNSDANHSFIQVLNGNETKYDYIKFKPQEFHYNKEKFDVSVGNNCFSNNHIELDLSCESCKIKGRLEFRKTLKWPDSLLNPGSMGFYNYLLFMECYSQVCLMNGETFGSLEIGGKFIDFSHGKVYIEKNWGRSFPKSWVWVQANSFGEDASITCSIGTVPFIRGSFSGFLVGLQLKNKFFSFTSINKSKMNIEREDGDVRLEFLREDYSLTLKTKSEKDKFIKCMGPKGDNMIPLVDETLLGSVEMELMDLKNNITLYKGTSPCAGIEYGGNEMIYQ